MYHDMENIEAHALHIILHIAPNYKTTLFNKQGICTHQYMLEPILLSAIQSIASMRLSSHPFGMRWGVRAQVTKI